MYLQIANDGLAHVEGFTILGLSSSINKDDKIGQFGSGAKHGVLTCLRAGLNPQIFIGNKKLNFFTEDLIIDDQTHRRVCYDWDGVKERTSMVLDYGGIDWTGLDMGLREFVSNALDSVSNDKNKMSVGTVSELMPSEGKTVIGIPLNSDVSKFYEQLSKKFLHFTNIDLSHRIIPKSVEDKTIVYRMGVYVTEISQPALYHYNVGSELKIDECRNLSNYNARLACSNIWREASVEQLKELFKQIDRVVDGIWEYNLDTYYLKPQTQNQKAKWAEAWRSVYGDVIIAGNHTPVSEKVKRKGYQIKIVSSSSWLNALCAAGIKPVFDIAVQDGISDKKGRQITPAPSNLLVFAAKIWAKLEKYGLTKEKPMPAVKSFLNLMDGTEMTLGYYENGTIYIADGYHQHAKVILEEFAHHITGSTDNSRDFQDYAFTVATTFMNRRK